MCAKYFHGEMALQRNVLFLGLPVYDSVDYVWDHISEGKACIKNPKICGPSKSLLTVCNNHVGKVFSSKNRVTNKVCKARI